jgi:large subunit ribosomal protein L13
MRTKSYKISDIEEKWHLVDASGQTLGRLSAKVSTILMGKKQASIHPPFKLG